MNDWLKIERNLKAKKYDGIPAHVLNAFDAAGGREIDIYDYDFRNALLAAHGEYERGNPDNRGDCPRCNGSGSYSYNSRHGSMCYGCNGTGWKK